MKKLLSLLICLAMVLCFICGCSPKDPYGNKAFPVNIGGAKISKLPTHIAVLSPGIYAVLNDILETDANVVAVSDYTALDLKNLTAVGTADEPDINTIVGLSCDLVLTNSKLSQENADLLSNQGVPVAVVSAPTTFDGLQEYYRQLACLCLGNVAGYATSNTVYENMIAQINQVSTDITDKKSAVLLLDEKIVATSGTVGDSLLTYAGFDNAAKNLQTMEIDFSTIKDLNPSVIFCDSLILDSIKSSTDLTEIDAVKNNCVFGISVLSIELLGSGIYDSAKQMREYVYGELVMPETGSSED